MNKFRCSYCLVNVIIKQYMLYEILILIFFLFNTILNCKQKQKTLQIITDFQRKKRKKHTINAFFSSIFIIIWSFCLFWDYFRQNTLIFKLSYSFESNPLPIKMSKWEKFNNFLQYYQISLWLFSEINQYFVFPCKIYASFFVNSCWTHTFFCTIFYLQKLWVKYLFAYWLWNSISLVNYKLFEIMRTTPIGPW